MLRSLIQPESKLIKLCQSREWNKVIQLASALPKEAKPSSTAYRGIANTALIVAIRNTAPLKVIQALIDANSDQLMKVRHHRHGNALHEAIKYKSSIDVVLFLIETIVVLEKEVVWVNRGELRPVHIECKQSKNKRQISSQGLEESNDSSSTSSSAFSSSFAQSNKRLHTHCTLFNQNDSMGRTPLHCLVDRFCKGIGPSKDFINALKLLIIAFPPAVGKVDSEGLTPLDISLITPNSMLTTLRGMDIEIKIYNLVKIMIDAFPSAAASRFNAAQASVFTATSDVIESNVQQLLLTMNNTSGTIAHNTLSHALMHGRHISTIELVLGAAESPNSSWCTGQLEEWEEYEDHHRDEDDDRDPKVNGEHASCMAIVSKEYEVPLHIAVTMKASPDVIARLVEYKPEATTVLDRCLLSPICWTWIRFVIDEIESRGNEPGDEGSSTRTIRSTVKASRRRFIPNSFMTVQKEMTENMIQNVIEIISNRPGTASIEQKMRGSIEKRSLWSNLLTLLPSAAKVTSNRKGTNERLFGSAKCNADQYVWDPVHAAAYLECPKGVILSAIKNRPQSLKEADKYGNLPIHYAAACRAYSKSVPIGVRNSREDLVEESNVFELVAFYPNSTKVKNIFGQLPIHIAIEEEKKRSSDRDSFKARLLKAQLGLDDKNKRQRTLKKNFEKSPLMCLVRADIDSLEQRDSVTNLYPFMQVAARPSNFDDEPDNFVSLDYIFVMLQLNPSLVKTKLNSK